jgi:hypothetical protein
MLERSFAPHGDKCTHLSLFLASTVGRFMSGENWLQLQLCHAWLGPLMTNLIVGRHSYPILLCKTSADSLLCF